MSAVKTLGLCVRGSQERPRLIGQKRVAATAPRSLGPVSRWAGLPATLAAAGAVAWGLGGSAIAQNLSSSSSASLQPNVSELTVDLASIYDTNSAEASAALAAQEHLAQAEAILTPSAGLNLSRQLGADSLFVQASGGYDFHLRNHILDRERINAAGGGMVAISSCQILPTAGYSRSQEQLQDLARPFVSNVVAIQSYQVGFQCLRTTGFSPTLTLSRLSNVNGSEVLSNYRVYTANGGVAYDQPVLGRAVLFGEYQDVAFSDRPAIEGMAATQVGYDLSSGGLRISHATGSRIRLEAAVAYTNVKNNIPGEAGYQGATYTVQGTYAPSYHVSFDVNVAKSIQPSNDPGVTFVKDAEESVDAIYTFPSRGELSVGASTEDRDYEGFDLLSAVFLLHERRNLLFASGTLRFSRLLAVELSTRYEKRIADPAIYTWSGLRTQLKLTATF